MSSTDNNADERGEGTARRAAYIEIYDRQPAGGLASFLSGTARNTNVIKGRGRLTEGGLSSFQHADRNRRQRQRKPQRFGRNEL